MSPEGNRWFIAKVEETTEHADEDSPAHAFIQWKGTDVCFDFYCDCGEQGHFDGYFAYQFRCGSCKTVYVFPHDVYAIKVDEPVNTLCEPVDLDMWDGITMMGTDDDVQLSLPERMAAFIEAVASQSTTDGQCLVCRKSDGKHGTVCVFSYAQGLAEELKSHD